MAIGIIKYFDNKHGFGFIKPDHMINEVLLHITELEKANIKALDEFALEGLRISFDIKTNKHNKPVATNIKIVIDQRNRKKAS